jgi:hypothetical protein
MKKTSRVVCITGANKGKTGTILSTSDTNNPYNVSFDSGDNGQYKRTDLLEIDDMKSISDMELEVGDKLYVSSLNKTIELVDFSVENDYFEGTGLLENGEVIDVDFNNDCYYKAI